MVEDNSLRDTLNQLITLQAQQLNAVNTLVQQNSQSKNAANTAAQPNASSAYGMYAPNYMPPQQPFSPLTQAARNQYATYASNLNASMSFKDTVFANSSKISPQNRQMMAADFGANASNAALAGMGVAGAGVAELGASMLAPGILGSLAFGAVGGAAVGTLFNIGLDQNKQTQAYNKYLLQNSYRFINTAESNNNRDIDGFSFNERYQAAGFLRHFNTQMRISDDDTMTLLQKYTEGGLLKDVKDLETFKNKMTQLTKSVKTSALLLNDTFENVSQLMSDMEKAGITSKNFDYLSAKARVGGGYTGMSATEFMNTVNGITQGNTQGTAYSNLNTNLRAGESLVYTTALYDKAKSNQSDVTQRQLYDIITNMGGASNATNIAMQAQNQLLNSNYAKMMAGNFAAYDSTTGAFSIDQNKFQQFLKNGGSMTALGNSGMANINSWGPEGALAFEKVFGTMLANGLDNNQVMSLLSKITSLQGNAMGLKNTASVLETQGMDANTATFFGGYLDFYRQDNGALSRQYAAQTAQKQTIESMNAMRTGLGYEITNTWEKFKDSVGDLTSPIGQAANSVGQWFNDKWNGIQYSDGSFMRGRNWSSDQLKQEGKDVVTSLLDGVKQGLQEAKNSGYNVTQDTINYYSALMGESSKVGNVKNVGTNLFNSSLQPAMWQDTISTYNKYRSGFETFRLGANMNEMSQKIAGSLGISYDGSANSYAKLQIGVNSKMAEYQKLLDDYEKNGDTSAWITKYSTADRAEILKEMQVMSDYVSGGTSGGLSNFSKYLTQADQAYMNNYVGQRTGTVDIHGRSPKVSLDKFLEQASKDTLVLGNGMANPVLGLKSNMSIDEAIKSIDKQLQGFEQQKKDIVDSDVYKSLVSDIQNSNAFSAADKQAALDALTTGDYKKWTSYSDSNIARDDKDRRLSIVQRVITQSKRMSPVDTTAYANAEDALKAVQSRGQDFSALGLAAASGLIGDESAFRKDLERMYGPSSFKNVSWSDAYNKQLSGEAFIQSQIEHNIMSQSKDNRNAFVETMTATLTQKLGSQSEAQKYIDNIKQVYSSGGTLDNNLFRELVEKLLTKMDAGNTDVSANNSAAPGGPKDVTGLLVQNNDAIAGGIELIRKMTARNEENLSKLQADFKSSWYGMYMHQ